MSPHCIVLIYVVWWSLAGRSFGHFHILPGREEEWWPHEGLVFTHVVAVVDMVSCGYGDFGCESATRFRSYWKKPAFDTSKETLLPPNWEGLRKHSGVHVKNSYQSCHPQTLHSNSINRKPRSFEINDNIFTVCKLKTQQNGTIYLFTSLHSKN